MPQDMLKVCADSLRTFTKEKYGLKLKSSHAHELVAAFLGYRTKNTMLADVKYPISKLSQAKVIVLISDDFIDQRRKNLDGLLPKLPDSYTLGEVVYTSLFSDQIWSSQYPPFRSFKLLAKFFTEHNDACRRVFRKYRNVTIHHLIDVKETEGSVLLTITHAHENTSGDLCGIGKNSIYLPRIAGKIGYDNPHISVPEIWTAGARKPLGALEALS